MTPARHSVHRSPAEPATRPLRRSTTSGSDTSGVGVPDAGTPGPGRPPVDATTVDVLEIGSGPAGRRADGRRTDRSPRSPRGRDKRGRVKRSHDQRRGAVRAEGSAPARAGGESPPAGSAPTGSGSSGSGPSRARSSHSRRPSGRVAGAGRRIGPFPANRVAAFAVAGVLALGAVAGGLYAAAGGSAPATSLSASGTHDRARNQLTAGTTKTTGSGSAAQTLTAGAPIGAEAGARPGTTGSSAASAAASAVAKAARPSARAATTMAAAPRHATAPVLPPVAPAPAVAAPAGDPFGNIRFFVDPSAAASAAIASLVSNAAEAAAVRKVANGPQADWFGSSGGNVQAAVAGRAAEVRASGALPVFVAYNIPKRDCGGYSSGGATSPDAYRAWIRQFAAGLGHGPAAVILEPDALPNLDCLSAADQQTRYGLLSDAVNVLSGAGISVYLDAGSSTWKSAATIAQRLRSAGVAHARGFSLNVSNFNTTPAETAYGDSVVAALGGAAHYIVDTSRNGLGPTADHQWCNPPGRGLGKAATAATGDTHADAFYWIKRPGESDGTCNGGPSAGAWWTNYAVGLGQRAAG